MSVASRFLRTTLGTVLLLSVTATLLAQQETTTPTPTPTKDQTPAPPGGAAKNPADQPAPKLADSTATPTEVQKQLDDITKYLADQKTSESDFSLVLGIGSLILAPGVTDYINQSNVLAAANLGKATPQLLTGVSFRTRIPSLFTRFGCGPKHKDQIAAAGGQYSTNPCYGEVWQRNPWNAFVSLKFAPGASNPINGYVLGGSFSLAHYMDFTVGFALTPVSEPSPGFRVVASQFVTAEQQQGLYMNFNPTAMLNNKQNAFDGFPTTNPSTGALLYPGNPLATHYRGGVVIGVSLPIAFSAFLRGGAPPPNSPSAKAGNGQ
jgi:hypothetical protein